MFDNNLKTMKIQVSPIENLAQNRAGYYNLDTAVNFHKEDSVEHSSDIIYGHEKTCNINTIGVPNNNGYFISHYFHPFPINDTYGHNDSKMLVQCVLDGIYPTDVASYISIKNGITGVATLDFNNLCLGDEFDNLPVEAIRLDDFILKMKNIGILPKDLFYKADIQSFYDLQCLINNKDLDQFMTPRAKINIALSTFFIPNAIGETDANSRNVILLKDPITNKIDVVVRIDAESNTFINDEEHERTGLGLPKGMFAPFEPLRDVSGKVSFISYIRQQNNLIDWDLFKGLYDLTKTILTESTIMQAAYSGYRKNFGKIENNELDFMMFHCSSKFGYDRYEKFADKTIDRVKRFFGVIDEAFKVYRSGKLPNYMSDSKMGALQPKLFDDKGIEFQK